MHNLDFNLKINSHTAKPGDILSPKDLNAADFEEVNYWGKLLLGKQRGHKVYHAKHCEVSYLNDRSKIIPNPYRPYDNNIKYADEISDSADFEAELQAKYSNKYQKPDLNGITYFCDTSAYYFLEKDYSVREINFQLLNNIYLAGEEYFRFIDLCNRRFGQAMYLYDNSTVEEPGVGVTAGWCDENSCLYANLSKDEEHFMIIWLINTISNSYYRNI